MAQRLKFLAFGCLHAPLEDPEAVDWLVERVAKVKPDVLVHLGDGHEADSASRWPSEYPFTLSDEFVAHDAILALLRKAAPKARRVFCWGNHDANLLTINRIDRRLRNLCDPRQHEPELEHWRHVPYVYCRNRGVYRIGQVTFTHGYECGTGGDPAQAILLGVPYGLTVLAHTHRPAAVEQVRKTAGIPLPYWSANAGTLRDLKPPYVERKRTHQWGHAIVTGWAEDLKSPRVGPQWEAQTEVLRLYDAWADGRTCKDFLQVGGRP